MSEILRPEISKKLILEINVYQSNVIIQKEEKLSEQDINALQEKIVRQHLIGAAECGQQNQ